MVYLTVGNAVSGTCYLSPKSSGAESPCTDVPVLVEGYEIRLMGLVSAARQGIICLYSGVKCTRGDEVNRMTRRCREQVVGVV